MSKLPRIVIDTNVLLDIFHFHDTHVQELKLALENGQLEVWTCQLMWNEFLNVIQRPLFGNSTEEIQAIIQKILPYFQFESNLIPTSPYKCKDTDDQIFIDLACLKSPCHLLSKDKAVLKLKSKLKTLGVTIITPKEIQILSQTR